MPRIRTAPTFYIRVRDLLGANPKRVDDQTARVVSLKYKDTEAGADKLTLTITNFHLENFDDPIWAQGNIIEASWGYPGNMTPTRLCKITSVKGSKLLAVEAVDQSIQMNKVTQERTFRGLTRSQIVAQIAANNGYGADAQHIEDTKVVYDSIHQARETDAAFMRRLAQREGFEFFVDFDGLHWHKRKLGQQPLREFIYFTDPAEGDVLDFNITNDVTARPAQITVAGRDLMNKKHILETGDNASTPRAGLAGILDAFTSAPAPKQGNEAADKDGPIRVVNPITGETGMRVIHHTTEPHAAGAKRQADGAYRKAVMTVLMTLKAVGDPNQVAKSIVTLKGFGTRLSGNYYCADVEHRIQGSYEMELTLKRDGRSELPHAPAAQRSDGKINGQKPKDGGTLEPIRTVDAFGRTKTSYRDTRGRPQGGGSE